MKCPSIPDAALLVMFVFPVGVVAQTHCDTSAFRSTVFAPPPEIKKVDFGTRVIAPATTKEKHEAMPIRAQSRHSDKRLFLILSGAVYAASFADMHQTVKQRKYDWWYESDPLARPFVRLPAPAYYATGLAMATGINWLSWKMGHSRRWHRLAYVPQLLSIGGNTYGYKSNLFSSTN